MFKMLFENSLKKSNKVTFNYVPLNSLDHECGYESEQFSKTQRYSVQFVCKDFAIANVQCQYDSPSDTDDASVGSIGPVGSVGVSERLTGRPPDDHTYDTRDEPPAFIIQQIASAQQPQLQVGQVTAPPYVEIAPKFLTLGPGCGIGGLNVIHVGDQHSQGSQVQQDCSLNKRIRRSESLLRQAADCVSRGHTFQTVSQQFNIPISTIRFFMARKGILPRRRRGRSTHIMNAERVGSPEPPFHMQHYKLPANLTETPTTQEEEQQNN